ncbi:MAG TPA: glycosyltransferase family 4 protein [Paucimonas sp.]|nr:glycosyltransferase family 4 protein [Paucimonas sp.]
MHKVAHLTSVHSRNDTRIFVKQCRSLASSGYDITLVVADGKGDESREGVRIADVGRPPGRIERMLRTTRRVFDKAVALDADVYHLHDPELLPTGLRLKRLGKKVVFDSHEDVPRQILGKPYLDPLSRRVLSRIAALYERHACGRLDGVVAATPFIRDKFLAINARTVDVNNFPVLGELDAAVPWHEKNDEVCYVGDISASRGMREIVRACEYLESPVRLNLGGRFSDAVLEADVKSMAGWRRVNELGFLDRSGVRKTLGRSIAGLVVLHPLINYLDALPVKMFEYMAAGIPVIASDFPLWRGIVEEAGCGLCVDPLAPRAIASAIDRLHADPEAARRMGENGRRAVRERFNWALEEEKFRRFYAGLM